MLELLKKHNKGPHQSDRPLGGSDSFLSVSFVSTGDKEFSFYFHDFLGSNAMTALSEEGPYVLRVAIPKLDCLSP